MSRIVPSLRNKTLRAIARYSTPRKLANLARAIRERRNRSLVLRSLPYKANIDVTNACNLECTFCPTGQQHYGRKVEMVSLDRVDHFLDEIGDYLFMVHLYLWGEPFLHPQIGEIVSTIHSRRIFTEISTNLNITKRSQLDAVCDGGLDHLIMSIDGASQEVYADYRKTGELDLVLENVAYLVDYKRRNRLKYPTLEWRFLRFDHNHHEVDAARDMATKLGVDLFTVDLGLDCAKIDQQSSEAVCSDYLSQPTCKSLYSLAVLHPDGGIAPCCVAIDKRDDFGDPDASLRDVWNNERYIQARKMFVPERLHELPANLDHLCLHCPLVQIRPHMRDYLKNNPTVEFEGILRTKNGEMAIRSNNSSYLRSRSNASQKSSRGTDTRAVPTACGREHEATHADDSLPIVEIGDSRRQRD